MMYACILLRNTTVTVVPRKAKLQYLLTLEVNIYCLLALQNSAAVCHCATVNRLGSNAGCMHISDDEFMSPAIQLIIQHRKTTIITDY